MKGKRRDSFNCLPFLIERDTNNGTGLYIYSYNVRYSVQYPILLLPVDFLSMRESISIIRGKSPFSLFLQPNNVMMTHHGEPHIVELSFLYMLQPVTTMTSDTKHGKLRYKLFF